MKYVLEVVDQNDEPLDSIVMGQLLPCNRVIHTMYSESASLKLECFLWGDAYISDIDTYVQYVRCYMEDWMYERLEEIKKANN